MVSIHAVVEIVVVAPLGQIADIRAKQIALALFGAPAPFASRKPGCLKGLNAAGAVECVLQTGIDAHEHDADRNAGAKAGCCFEILTVVHFGCLHTGVGGVWGGYYAQTDIDATKIMRKRIFIFASLTGWLLPVARLWVVFQDADGLWRTDSCAVTIEGLVGIIAVLAPLLPSKQGIYLFVIGFGLSGCADYMNHRDSVTLGAGNAVEANIALHTEKPFNPDSMDTDIDIEGNRLVKGPPASAGGGSGAPMANNNPCDYTDDIMKNGRACGPNAAEVRPGGETPPVR